MNNFNFNIKSNLSMSQISSYRKTVPRLAPPPIIVDLSPPNAISSF